VGYIYLEWDSWVTFIWNEIRGLHLFGMAFVGYIYLKWDSWVIFIVSVFYFHMVSGAAHSGVRLNVGYINWYL